MGTKFLSGPKVTTTAILDTAAGEWVATNESRLAGYRLALQKVLWFSPSQPHGLHLLAHPPAYLSPGGEGKESLPEHVHTGRENIGEILMMGLMILVLLGVHGSHYTVISVLLGSLPPPSQLPTLQQKPRG